MCASSSCESLRELRIALIRLPRSALISAMRAEVEPATERGVYEPPGTPKHGCPEASARPSARVPSGNRVAAMAAGGPEWTRCYWTSLARDVRQHLECRRPLPRGGRARG